MPPHARKILAGLILLAASAQAASAQQASANVWMACVREHAIRFAVAVKTEPAETIISAALVECRPQESLYADAMARSGEDMIVRSGIIERVTLTMRQTLLPVVLKAKAGLPY